jgi:hypothetical protein
MEIPANRPVAGDWHFVTGKLWTEVIGNGGKDLAVSEVPKSAGLGGGQRRELGRSRYGTFRKYAEFLQRRGERTFIESAQRYTLTLAVSKRGR